MALYQKHPERTQEGKKRKEEEKKGKGGRKEGKEGKRRGRSFKIQQFNLSFCFILIMKVLLTLLYMPVYSSALICSFFL